MVTVTYAGGSHGFVVNPPGKHSHVQARPWVEVVARWSGHRHRIWCLVDTGADDTFLDLGTATALGINWHSLPLVKVGTVGAPSVGGPRFWLQQGLQLDFAGASVPADVLFGALAVPLLGRPALLSGVEAGFETSAWYHT